MIVKGKFSLLNFSSHYQFQSFLKETILRNCKWLLTRTPQHEVTTNREEIWTKHENITKIFLPCWDILCDWTWNESIQGFKFYSLSFPSIYLLPGTCCYPFGVAGAAACIRGKVLPHNFNNFMKSQVPFHCLSEKLKEEGYNYRPSSKAFPTKNLLTYFSHSNGEFDNFDDVVINCFTIT